MPHLFKDFFIVFVLVALGAGFVVFNTLNYYPSQISSVLDLEQTPLLPEGTLIKSQNDERVYYIEGGKKRWLESKEAFRIQGFLSEDIKVISDDELNRYQEGELINGYSNIILPEETGTLPDLVPLAITGLQLKKLNGRTILKFTASFWNQGKRHFELATSPKTDVKDKETYQEVYQPIAGKNGKYRNKTVGSFYWHVPHTHYHYSDFADYVFSFIRPLPGDLTSSPPQTIRQKTTFCIRDNELLSLAIPGAPKKAAFPTCGQEKQGISVGWVDIYKNTLPDQYIDVHDMPAGIYGLSFFVDPNQHFVEEHKNNNISTAFIELNVKNNTAKIIASAAPFVTALNNFPDKTLIRAGGEEKLYVIHNNKKRPVSNLEVFNSYGYVWDEVLALTQSMLDSIPLNNLIRLKDTDEVYALNNFGHKRRILNSDVFYSYGFKSVDIADINQTEFSSYPESNLIRFVGSGDIYLMVGSAKKKIGPIDMVQNLGYDLNAIHTVNGVDFNSYTTTPTL